MTDTDISPASAETVVSHPYVSAESAILLVEEENNYPSLDDEVLLSRSILEALGNKDAFQVPETSTLGKAISEVSKKTKERPDLEHGCAVYTKLITDWRSHEPRVLEITNISTGNEVEVNLHKQKPTDHFEVMLHSHPVDSPNILFSPFDVSASIRESSQSCILMLQSSEGDNITLMMINPLHSNFDRETRQEVDAELAKIDEDRSKEIMEVINQGFVNTDSEEKSRDAMRLSVDKIFDISTAYEIKMFDYLVSKGFLFYKSSDNITFQKVNHINIPDEND